MTDGWTNVRGNKVHNLLVACQQEAFLVASVENSAAASTAEYLAQTFVPVLRELISKVGFPNCYRRPRV